ncbi:MAG: monovalent cation/H(+) antiporter subunit G [Ilumatobacter sp.]
MSAVLDAIGGICLILGASFALLAGIGVHRFRDPYSRMHAAAKCPTLGLMLAAIGAALTIRTFEAAATLLLVAVLQILTSPVGTHLAGRAVHLRVDVELDGPDELALDEAGD